MFWLDTTCISQESSVYSIQTICQMVLALSWKRIEGYSSILCCINHQGRISWPELHRLPLPWLWLKRLRRFWTATSLSGRSNSLHKGGGIGIGSGAPFLSSIGAISARPNMVFISGCIKSIQSKTYFYKGQTMMKDIDFYLLMYIHICVLQSCILTISTINRNFPHSIFPSFIFWKYNSVACLAFLCYSLSSLCVFIEVQGG